MKLGLLLCLAAGAVALSLIGCGNSSDTPPPHAYEKPNPPAPTPNKVWSKEDKIAAIQNAPISADQKKAAIAKIQSGG